MVLSSEIESVEIKIMILETLYENADKLLNLYYSSQDPELVSNLSYSRIEIEQSLQSIDINLLSDLMTHQDPDVQRLSTNIRYKLFQTMDSNQDMYDFAIDNY